MTVSREDIEAVARRVVELLKAEGPAATEEQLSGIFIDAATLARLLGVSRATVYANADQLGAIRLGKGKRARLRFDPTRLAAPDPRAELGRAVHPAARPRRSAKPSKRAGFLLPIRGGTAGAKRRRLSAQTGR
jgi:hypothetical protein